MSNKTKVMIEMTDGTKKEYTGDTVILFTVDQAEELLSGRVKAVKAGIVSAGKRIPAPIFGETIGSIFGNYMETRPNNGGKLMASFHLHEVANILEAKSKELKEQAPPQEVSDRLDHLVENLFKALRE